MKTLIALSILTLTASTSVPTEVAADPLLTAYFSMRLDQRVVVAAQGEEVATEGAKSIVVEGLSHKVFSFGGFAMRVMPTVESTVRYGPSVFALPGKGMVYVVSLAATEKGAAESLAHISESIARNLSGKITGRETARIGRAGLERSFVTLPGGRVKHLDGYLGKSGDVHFCVIFEYHATQADIAAPYITESIASTVLNEAVAPPEKEDPGKDR